jgi:hypothetical protein
MPTSNEADLMTACLINARKAYKPSQSWQGKGFMHAAGFLPKTQCGSQAIHRTAAASGADKHNASVAASV